MINRITLAAAATLILGSCQPETVTPWNTDYRNGVLVVNEGPFQTGTGTLTFVQFQRGSTDSTRTILNAFQQVNGRVLGNIAQSAVRVGDRLLVAVHLAGTIEVMNAKTLESLHTFTGMGLPRYFQALPNGRVAVSDWQDQRVYLLDLETFQVVDTASVDPGPEGMAWVPQSGSEGALMVACSGGFGQNNTVVVLDSDLNRLETLTVGDQPHSFAPAPDGSWWVLNQGFTDWTTPANSTPGSLYRIFPQGWDVELKVTAPDALLHPSHLLSDENYFYFLSDRYAGSVVRIPQNAASWSSQTFLSGTHYSYAWDPTRNEWYAGKIVDFSGPGRLVRYNATGQALDSVTVGQIPGFILPEHP